jgi:ubiquinone/menaquinone biosynthesis C-methylase UbiE
MAARGLWEDVVMPGIVHFSWVAPYYDRLSRAVDVEPLLRYLDAQPHHRVLDVGGGTGRVSKHLVGQVGQVCVLDPTLRMVQIGRRKGICSILGEAEQLPFPDKALDRILVVHAFHHLRDQAGAVRELMRVLAPGGRVVVEEADVSYLVVKLVALGERTLGMRSQFLGPQAMGWMFEQVGGKARIERSGHTCWIIVERDE